MMLKTESSTFGRKAVLETGIARLRRLLEAENAADATVRPRMALPPAVAVRTGLGELLAGNQEIPPRTIEPYECLCEGVWVGHDDRQGAAWVVAGFTPGCGASAPDADFPQTAPLLAIHPVVTGTQLPAWITLETQVDGTHIKPDTTVRIDVVADFTFDSPHGSSHTNTVTALLRCDTRDGGRHDVCVTHFPVTTVPMLHTLTCPTETWQHLIQDGAAEFVLMFFLPTRGNFRFNIYDLAVECA